MMDFVEYPLSAFGFSVEMTEEERAVLKVHLFNYRRAREKYEVADFEGEASDEELCMLADCAAAHRRDLAQAKAEILLNCAKRLAKEIVERA